MVQRRLLHDSLWRLLHNAWGKPRHGEGEPLPRSDIRLCAPCSISGASRHQPAARMRRLPHSSLCWAVYLYTADKYHR